MKETTSFQNRLDDSSESGKVIHNNAMQSASQTTESPATAKKSPLTRNRLGLIGLTFLLVMGILLMPIRVTQNEAKAAEPLTVTTIAVQLGKFLVLVAATWFVEKALDAATQKDLEDNGGITLPTGLNAIEARAWVDGAKWIGASYTETTASDAWDSDNQRWTGNWTTNKVTASQGDYFETNPVGTKDGKAMTARMAKSYLTGAKYTLKTVYMEVFFSEDNVWACDAGATAREDCLEEAKATALAWLREFYGEDVYFGHEFETITTVYNVEDYKMKGQWDDDGWSSLGHGDAVDKDADEYEGLLYWKYQEVGPSGYTGGYTEFGWGDDTFVEKEEKGREIIVFASYTPEIEYHPACGQNQRLTEEPHISDDINRTFEDRVKSYKEVEVSSESGMIYLRGVQVPGATRTHKVVDEKERVVVHYGETDYTIQN